MGKQVCIVGSGNWGSAIARLAGQNTAENPLFEKNVNMWVYEETIEDRKLTEIINTDHENVKYLPGVKLPENVVAIPDLLDAARNADLFVFVIPHQFIARLVGQMKGNIKEDAAAISLIKGINITDSGLGLISDEIRDGLGMDVSVLMGANIANEVARDQFCESTVGGFGENAKIFKQLFQRPTFRVSISEDPKTVELCGALKNIVACGAGFCDGLGLGDNTKAAIIRLGLIEMMSFAKVFLSEGEVKEATFFESCGVADLITTCYGGRNRKVSEAFAKTGKPLEELEKEMLNGQKLQGPETARELQGVLKARNIAPNDFPLFTAVYKCCYEKEPVDQFLKGLENHPAHQNA